jgi:aerobic-type carbon monoxide dehydrogenase small subunit (CoxS/CutS family)
MEITVNERRHQVFPGPAESLATTLREGLDLRGTKIACDRGECGACTVLLQGEPVYSCLTLTESIGDRVVTTIEGLVTRSGNEVQLHPMQRAFIEHDAVQCGFCTPGQILSAVALLERDDDPGEEAIAEAMSGNLCRCGTYPAIARAIRAAATERRAGPGA